MRWLDHPVFLNGVGFLLFFTACVVAFGGAYYGGHVHQEAE